MEFFECPCNGTGTVFIDTDNNLGPNKDAAGNLVTFKCETGLHEISLVCLDDGKHCVEQSQKVVIQNTNPINPQKVPFTCAP